MHIRSVRVGLAVVALLLIAPRVAPVDAQPATPAKLSDADKKKIAKGYVDAGLAAQDAGDYATALDLYAKAYALVPHPVLLYNQGQAHRLAGHRAEAMAKYRDFLATSPRGDEAATAKKWLATMEAEDAAKLAAEKAAADSAAAAKAAAAKAAAERVAAEKAAAAEAAAEKAAADKAAAETAAAAKAAADARQRDEAAAREAAAQREREAAAARRATSGQTADTGAPDRGRTLRLAGIATGAVGLAAIGAGIAFGVRAQSISDELSMLNAEYTHAKAADGEAANRNMIISYVAGGALVAGGTTMYLLSRARSRESTRLTVAPRTGGAMVVFSGVLP